MAYRFTGTDPFLRAAIGAFLGFDPQGASGTGRAVSGAALLKRRGTGTWQGIWTGDNGSGSVWHDLLEFNPSNHLVSWDGEPGTPAIDGGTALADTTNWMIVAFTWDGTANANAFKFYWKVGTGAWNTASFTGPINDANHDVATSAFRHIIGNEPGLGDDGNFDLVCVGAIKGALTATQVESLNMAGIASWDAVFTGSGAWLMGFDAISSRTDRTGNGGNEINRSSGITLVADPTGFSWSSTGTISAGKVTTGAAVQGADLSASGAAALQAGAVAGGGAVRGSDLSGGTATVQPGKIATGQATRGANVAASGSATLAAGATPSSELVRGANATASGPATVDAGKLATGEAVHGANLTSLGGDLLVGKVTSSAAAHGADLAAPGAATLAAGKVSAGAAVRGAGLLPGTATQPAGKITSGAAVHGADLRSTSATIAAGKVTSSPTVRGVTLMPGTATLTAGRIASGSAVRAPALSGVAVTVAVGRVASAATVRGADLVYVSPEVFGTVTLSDAATASAELTEAAGAVELIDAATASVVLTEIS